MRKSITVIEDFREFTKNRKFRTILADPPWQFQNRTGKMAPEHKRLNRYQTLTLDEIKSIPVKESTGETAHLYLWVPNALIAEGLEVMKSWGFTYKTNLIWYKIRKDGGPDRRGVGFYFRNVTEVILFGVKGKNARTLKPGRSQENIIVKQKREHSRKPDEQYQLIESCSQGPYLEMFARGSRPNWITWGNQAKDYYPEWDTYKNHSQNGLQNVNPRKKDYGNTNNQLALLDRNKKIKYKIKKKISAA
jgi:N6-adenosine-specific RNA methylase IME4